MSLADSSTLRRGQSSSSSSAAAPIPAHPSIGSVPRLAEPFEPKPSGGDLLDSGEQGKKRGKRGLFGFGKKKGSDDGARESQPKTSSSKPEPSSSAVATATTPAPAAPVRRTTASPIQTEFSHAVMIPSSPGRNLSSSSHLSSPAGSQIFERDVQESNALIPNSPAIPAHVRTENHIPPVLDASSEAITDDHLDPDTVEIITHSSHQPASVTVTGAAPISPSAVDVVGSASSWADELASFSERDATDSASNYGSFDATDVRRLSFISFADVVQSEHAASPTPGPTPGGAASQRDSIHLAGLTSLPSAGLVNRSPSPIRSPVSSAGGGPPGTSPPTSKSGSIKGLDLSPARKPLGSPTSSHHHYPLTPGGGELNIETMGQALRRTGSRDLSSIKSFPTSPVEGPSR